jgi:hypothetical protein
MATGTKVGTATHDVVFISVLTWDHLITFLLAYGDLVSHALEAVGADPTRRGHRRLRGVRVRSRTVMIVILVVCRETASGAPRLDSFRRVASGIRTRRFEQ